MNYHELALIIPEMSQEDYEALKSDIKENGLLNPIMTYNNEIVDGRHRYKACIELGIEPRFIEWTGEGDLTTIVLSLNLKRRHLTASQKACIAVGLMDYWEKKAKENMSAGGGDRKSGSALVRNPIIKPIDTAKKVAETMDTGERYVQEAKRLQAEAPDKFEQVKAGEKTCAKVF